VKNPLSLVSEAVERFGLINPEDRLIVGFSGGPDSVFLVLALRELYPETEIHLVHLDHGLRDDSARDADFCSEFAREMGIPITLRRSNVGELARELGVGVEEAGRAERYRLFRETKESLGFTKIATGHTLSDWFETYLMNLFRGAGIRGIRGLAPRAGDVVRPLILLEKEAIMDYLTEAGIPFREDPTNLDTSFTRNWVRHELLPRLRARFYAGADALRKHLIAVNEAWEYIRKEAEALAEETARPSPRGEHIFNRDALLCYNSFLFKMMVLEIIPGVSAEHLEELVAVLGRGGEFHLPGSWKAQASERDLRFFQRELPGWKGEMLVEREGVYPVPDLNLALEVSWRDRSEGPFSASFPRSVLPFTLRTRRPGDRWGAKNLKDKMISLRIPAWRRDLIPLVVQGNRVLWIPGFAAWRVRGRAEITLRIRRLSDEFWVYDF
jgi:tRNA(Ile)-lysidine synthase